jgi:predicted Zn-dependent protease
MNTVVRQFFTFLFLIFLVHGCAINPVTGEQDFVLISEDEELEIGREQHKSVMGHYKAYQHEELQNYVTQLGEELADISHRKEIIFHFTVLDSQEVNAFALPGGYIYITRGLLSHLNNEAQLVGVIGHEIGHVTARHGVKQQSKATVAQILTTILGATTGNRHASDIGQLLGMTIITGYGRAHELEADRIGAEYMAHLGYDPEELLGVIGVLKAQEEFDKELAKEEDREPRYYHGIFATHPDNDKRLQELIKAAGAKYKGKDLKANQQEFFKRIDGLIIGPGEHEGVVRGRYFYHKELDFKISFPPKWKIENHPHYIRAFTPNKKIVIQVGMRDLNRKVGPKEFIKRKFKDECKQGRVIKTEDFEGYTCIVELDHPEWGERPARYAIIYRTPKDAFEIMATTEESDLKYFDGHFLSTINSVRKLKKADLKEAEPKRIKIIKVEKGDTFAKYAHISNLGNRAEDKIRILNNAYPKGEPTPGTYVKIVQ